MTRRARLLLLFAAVFCTLPGIVCVVVSMPEFGGHALPYGDAVNARAPLERHITNMVSAVNFDYRGFDTLGEEFMLLGAVTGVVVLLRGNRGEQLDARPGLAAGKPLTRRTDAMVLMGRMLSPLVVLFGMYVALHAMTTPGGGFQGGVIIATGFLLVFLTDGYAAWRRIARSRLLDGFEGGGAALYVSCGAVPFARHAPFLTNVLPLGSLRDIFAGGSLGLLNAGVTLAVSGGFVILFLEFLEETRAQKSGEQT